MSADPAGTLPRSRWPSPASATCVALLAVLPYALFFQITLGDKVFAEGDLLTYNFPLLHEIARQWKLGQAPLWHPYIFGGTPLLAQMQGGAFYPPNFLFLLLPGWLAFSYTILLHYALAGMFTFAFIRGLGLGRKAAFLGGLIFMLCGFTMSHLGHVSLLRTVPWLPLILFGFDRWRLQADRRGLGVGAMAVGLMVLAGHPQVPLYALLVTVSYGLWFAARARERERRAALTGLVTILAVGGLIGAVQWMTMAAAVPEYLRPTQGDYKYFTQSSLHPVMFANLVFPDLVPCDGSEDPGYLGIAGLALAGIGAFVQTRARRDLRLYFRGLVLVSLPLMLGGYTPLARFLVHIPLFGTFLAPSRHWFELSFAAAVLAALGFEALESSPERARQWTRRAALGLALSALLAIAAVAFVRASGFVLPQVAAGLREGPFPWLSVQARLGWLAASVTLVLALGASRSKRRAALLLPVVLAGDLFSYGGGLYGSEDPRVVQRLPRSIAVLRAEPEPFRILGLEEPVGLDQSLECLIHNWNGTLGVESVNGFDSITLRALNEASGTLMPTWGLIQGAPAYQNPQFQRFVDLLNARYVLVPAQREVDLPSPRYVPVYANELVRIYRNEEALPRLFVAPTARRVTHQEALDALASGSIDGHPLDLRRQALVESPPGLDLPQEGTVGTAGIRILRLAAGDVEAMVETPSAGVLVHASNLASGWTVVVDGAEQSILRVNALVQGVVVPAGRHHVRFRYRPRSFIAGAALSVAGLVIAAHLFRSLR